MGDEPRNAASAFIRDSYPRFGELAALVADGQQSWRDGFAEDFRREDRRGLVGIDTADSAELIDSMLAYWDLGEGEPTFRVMEVNLTGFHAGVVV